MKYKILYVLLCIVLASTLLSQEWYESKVIILESSSDILINPINLDYNLSKESTNTDALVDLSLQEARLFATILFSSVIYGYKFLYKPFDSARNIVEHWELELVAPVPIEDEKLIRINQEIFQGQLSVVYRYNLSEDQVTWLRSWEIADILPGEGTGIAYVESLSTIQAKTIALEKAIKSAIRNRLRQHIPSKPLEVEGLVKVETQPFIYQSGEYYHAEVKVKMQINNIKEQQLF